MKLVRQSNESKNHRSMKKCEKKNIEHKCCSSGATKVQLSACSLDCCRWGATEHLFSGLLLLGAETRRALDLLTLRRVFSHLELLEAS
ncbi:hypothetical protein LR48_Vigan07g265200 [Vigna angularis]|uniref:Uncharacterized protein n=1 Tax=Phaseolus angularis TaxID=3914 RepID=A0A0L9V1R0_PHAAN|nr:hypothetical protein LR48_Vigan07g265200 [Vigna angularis]